MAEVFRAKAVGDAGFEKVVALKCILPHMADDREFVDMFIDEARTVAQLSHANICQIFEFGQQDGVYYIALELVEGKDLKRIMEYHRLRGRPLPLPCSLNIIRRACEALDYAHNCVNAQGQPMNIVHRDISPQNILVSYAGEVKLIDFGIAKAMGRLTKTASGSIKGKFGYMSPEQVIGRPIDPRSDIFACGTLLWELLTNERLFKAESDLATMQLVRKARVPPPSSINIEVPAQLDRITLHALAREPENRYRSAGALLDDLEQFVLESGNSCSAQQLARWMDDVFAQDRALADNRARVSEEQLLLASQPTQIHAEPAPGEDELETRPSALPRVVATGRGTSVSGTFTETELAHVHSRLAWIAAGVLLALLVGGGVTVALLWPKQRVVKVAVPAPTATPRTSGIAEADSRAPAPLARVTLHDAAPVERHRVRHHPARRRAPRRQPRPVSAPPAATRPPPAATEQPPRPGGPGILLVASRPWARVWIDGRDTGRNTPIAASAPLRLSPGRHTVTLFVKDQRFDFPVLVEAGETTKLIRKLPVTR